MEEINIKEKYIDNLFKNTSASYKFFWFKAILNNLQDSQISTIKFNDLVNEMICLAWPIVVEQKRTLGNKDAIEEVIEYISNYVLEKDDGHIWPIEDLRDYLKITTDKEIMSKKRKAIENVPYRFLSPFLVDFNEAAWRLSKPELAAVLSGKLNVMYKIGSYSDLDTNIYIYPEWAMYLKANKERLIEYTDKELDKYLKKKETEVVKPESIKEEPQKEDEKDFSSVQSINFKESLNIKLSNYTVKPCVVTVARRAYRVSSWFEAFKIAMFYNCDKNKKLDWNELNEDIDKLKTTKKYKYIVKTDEESETFVKFYDDLYVHSFKDTQTNVEELKYFADIYGLKFDIYFAIKDTEITDLEFTSTQDIIIDELINKQKYKEKKAKYYISRINGRVLSKKEKLYKRIEKEFDKKILIGDILINDEESEILKEYMSSTLNQILSNSLDSINHEKVYAYGLIKYASKYYEKNRFWPYFKDEYGFEIPITKQVLINTTFEKIIKKYNKAYFDSEGKQSYTQNICMHNFVCDKCADQLFDYIFEFWRIDLSRSVENMVDDMGNNIFDILIDEIENDNNLQVQDVMIHTTMAMRANRRSCRSKFRRILMMIDDSYWNDTDYSSSSDRITILFNEWKKKSSSAFVKEQKKDKKRTVTGRGKKLLTSPTIIYDQENRKFKLILPKEILRFCEEIEVPIWTVNINNRTYSLTPTLLAGKASLYSSECELDINESDIFSSIDVTLYSEKRNYIKKAIPNDDIRFFSDSFRQVNINNDCISKESSYAFIKKGCNFEKIGSKGGYLESYNNSIDLYYLECSEGDLFILPNGKAVSVGVPIRDGLISANKVNGVNVTFESKDYNLVRCIDQLFFKTTKERMHGTSIKISDTSRIIYDGKIELSSIKEFKIDETIGDIFGYVVKLSDFIKKEGLYNIELNIPGLDIRKYSLCYLYDFEFEFIGAPYVFKDSATISFPSSFNPKNRRDFDINGNSLCLTFLFKETNDKDINNYYKDHKLRIESYINDKLVDFIFDVPVLYWKFSKFDEWSYLSPKSISIKDIPTQIFVTGDLPLSNALMFINDEMRYESETITHKDTENIFFFRAVDLKEHFGRNEDYKEVAIQINNNIFTFMHVACRSIIKNYNVVGNFEEQKIYGEFEIIGSSEYFVSISKNDEVIEDNIPLTNGKFEIYCDVEEGEYLVSLFEQEEDDSGFDSISFKLKDIPIQIKDLSNLTGRGLDVIGVDYVNQNLEGFNLGFDYKITSLNRLDYNKDIKDKIDIMTWLYDSSDYKVMSKFDYYRGKFVKNTGYNSNVCLFNALIILEKNNFNKVMLYCFDAGEAREVYLDTSKNQIIADDKDFSRIQRIRSLKVLYDDEYIIKVKVTDEDITITKYKTKRKREYDSYNDGYAKHNDFTKRFYIKDVNFSIRTYNCLHRAGIVSLNEISNMSYEELHKIRNLGNKQINEIISVLHRNGLDLKGE